MGCTSHTVFYYLRMTDPIKLYHQGLLVKFSTVISYLNCLLVSNTDIICHGCKSDYRSLN